MAWLSGSFAPFLNCSLYGLRTVRFSGYIYELLKEQISSQQFPPTVLLVFAFPIPQSESLGSTYSPLFRAHYGAPIYPKCRVSSGFRNSDWLSHRRFANIPFCAPFFHPHEDLFPLKGKRRKAASGNVPRFLRSIYRNVILRLKRNSCEWHV